MTAPAGTASFTTEESKAAEDRHTKIIISAVNQRPDFILVKSIDIGQMMSNVLGTNIKYGLLKNLTPQTHVADGGFLIHIPTGQVVAVFENKFQKARENACQRAFVSLFYWLLDYTYSLTSCYGPGFLLENGGGTTGIFLDQMRLAENVSHGRVRVLENPIDDVFTETLNIMLDDIERFYGLSKDEQGKEIQEKFCKRHPITVKLPGTVL